LDNSLIFAEAAQDVYLLGTLGFRAVQTLDWTHADVQAQFCHKAKGRDCLFLVCSEEGGHEMTRMAGGKLWETAKSIRFLHLERYCSLSDAARREGNEGVAALLALVAASDGWIESEEAGAWYATAKVEVPRAAPGHSAADILNMDLAPIEYLVADILPTTGLALLTGAPKRGKSWLALLLALRVAGGAPFLGRETKRTGVLYFALEDGYRRLKARLLKLLDGQAPPAGLRLDIEADRSDAGLFDKIKLCTEKEPDTGLIIIDTLQKIRGSRTSSNEYANDYAEIGKIKGFADGQGICILLIHHNRKMRGADDVFEMISGTNAILGAADTALLIEREEDSDSAILHITGRDAPEQALCMDFRKENCEWRVTGSAAERIERRKRAEYEANPLVQLIRRLTAQNNARWEGTSSDLIAAGEGVDMSPEKLTSKLAKLDADLLRFDGIQHARGTGSTTDKRKHVFTRTCLYIPIQLS